MRKPEHSNITSYHILDLARIFVIDWEQQWKTMNEKIYFALSIDKKNITPGQIHVHIQAFIHSIQWQKYRMEQKIDWKKERIISYLKLNRSWAFYYLNQGWSITKWFITYILHIFPWYTESYPLLFLTNFSSDIFNKCKEQFNNSTLPLWPQYNSWLRKKRRRIRINLFDLFWLTWRNNRWVRIHHIDYIKPMPKYTKWDRR